VRLVDGRDAWVGTACCGGIVTAGTGIAMMKRGDGARGDGGRGDRDVMFSYASSGRVAGRIDGFFDDRRRDR
jgi:hypothetical protein